MEKKQILPPQSLQGSEVHFAQVTWADQGTKFAVTWFNRIQNESVITLCDVNALDCSGEEIFRRVNTIFLSISRAAGQKIEKSRDKKLVKSNISIS